MSNLVSEYRQVQYSLCDQEGNIVANKVIRMKAGDTLLVKYPAGQTYEYCERIFDLVNNMLSSDCKLVMMPSDVEFSILRKE